MHYLVWCMYTVSQWRWLLSHLGVRDLMPLHHRRLHLRTAAEAAASPWHKSLCDMTAAMGQPPLPSAPASCANLGVSTANASPSAAAADSSVASRGVGEEAGVPARGHGPKDAGDSSASLPAGGVVVEDVECPGLEALVGSLVAKARR
eukprot:1158334-Pelagomonas_calceolata.AAC.2